MGANLKILCFEHHTQMRPSQILLRMGDKSWQVPAYVCDEPGCFVRYSGSRGYFTTTQDGSQTEGEVMPRITCPKDSRVMYLAEVRPEQRNYRLWRCPDCGTTLTNEELPRASKA
jgi:hypothetical protein